MLDPPSGSPKLSGIVPALLPPLLDELLELDELLLFFFELLEPLDELLDGFLVVRYLLEM